MRIDSALILKSKGYLNSNDKLTYGLTSKLSTQTIHHPLLMMATALSGRLFPFTSSKPRGSPRIPFSPRISDGKLICGGGSLSPPPSYHWELNSSKWLGTQEATRSCQDFGLLVFFGANSLSLVWPEKRRKRLRTVCT